MENFIDSHAHIADPDFASDCDEVISRAQETGAEAIICIGASIEQGTAAEQLARRYPGYVFFTAGIHPHDAATFDPAADIPTLREFMTRGAVAVGECGLDYHYDHSPRDAQRRAFAAQLALAKECNKPVVVHTREAEDDTRAMVTEAGKSGVRGVLHCYTGSHALARAALEVGWYVSFSGIVTFKKWTDDELIRLVPDDRLLAESDSPYLAPVPHRGKRNEPAWVTQTVARIANARGQSPDQVGRIVADNAKTLFSLNVYHTRSN
jgi:TatD DNase family protein